MAEAKVLSPEASLDCSGWSAGTARVMAGLCERAYEFQTLGSSLAHALVRWSEGRDQVFVAFRGSASARDWFTDLDCVWQDGIDGTGNAPDADLGLGRVHDGFWASATSIVDQVKGLTSNIQHPTSNIQWPALWITGHSKGAADAVLVAWLLERAGWRAQGVYLFGCPRVGDAGFRRNYQATLGERTWRVTNQQDIVCRVPSWIHGYRHVGTEVFLPAIGGMRMRPPLWFKLLSDLAGTYREYTQGKLAQLADHPINRYVEALRGT